MAAPRRFDLVVVGSGVGGYVAAIRAAQLGLSVAVVEQEAVLGGTCLNVGCIPSKALLDSSELYATARGGLAQHGIGLGTVSLDLAAMMERKRKIVDGFTRGVAGLLEANGVAVVHGTGRLSSPTAVEVTPAGGRSDMIEAGAIVLATGSLPIGIPALRFDGRRVISSTEALSLAEVPTRLLVVGAGAVGLELGSVWQRLGASVTVIEMKDQILPGFDGQAAATLARSLARQGLDIRTSAAVTGARVGDAGVALQARDASGAEVSLEGDVVLVAVGRRPDPADLGLDRIGVAVDPVTGRVAVDERFRTSVPSVYAIGDIVAGPMLAHKAEEEGIAAAENVAGRAGYADRSLVPSVVYTAPEVASVGVTEAELQIAGTVYASGSFVFRANGRALALGQTEGFVKVLADRATERLLGVHVVGPFASELIAEAVAVMAFGGSAEDIARTVHAHPSLAEVTREAALAAGGRPLHAPPGRPRGSGPGS